MKIVCTDTKTCGQTEKINKANEPLKSATICSYCGSLALYYSDEYEPIFKKQYSSLDIENTFVQMYLKILKLQGK